MSRPPRRRHSTPYLPRPHRRLVPRRRTTASPGRDRAHPAGRGARGRARDRARGSPPLPGTGVAPIRAVIGVVRALGAEPPAVVHVPMPSGDDDETGWARRLRDAALTILRDRESVAPR